MKTLKIIIFIYVCKLIDTYTFIDKEKSYIHYNQWNATRNGTLRFKFKTYSKDGLLLYTDNSKNTNEKYNSILLQLSYARLYVTVQMGAKSKDSRKTETIGDKLNDLEWHEVTITRYGRETVVTLDKKKELILNHDVLHESLELNSGLYVGGISQSFAKSKSIIDKNVLVMERFIGCIEQLEYSHSDSPNNFMREEIEKVRVKSGCLNACKNQTCPNAGKCINQFTKIKCDCIGTGYDGADCSKESESINFKGNTFITIDVARRQETTETNRIIFRFKTKVGNGVILGTMSGNDHLLIELYQNIVRVSVDLGGGAHVSEVNNDNFHDGKWHLVEIFRTGRTTSVRVDKKYCVNSSTPGVYSKLDIRNSYLYIGGHPNKNALASMNSQSKRNFTGCLQQVYYNGMDVIYKVNHISSPRFKTHGKLGSGCDVTARRVINSRANNDPGVSISNPGKVPGHNEPKSNETIKTTVNPRFVMTKEMIMAAPGTTLSRSSVVWITVGLVIGSIVLLITVGVIVHNVRHRYRAVLLSSSLKNLKDNNNSLHRKFSSNDRILRGSTDRMIHGSSDRLIRSSTDRLIRGSTDRLMRGSTDRIMRGSTDRIMRGSTDRIMRGSTDRLMRGNSERVMRASTDRIMRASTDRIPRIGDRSNRGSVHGSIPAINERYFRDKKERSMKPNGDISMNNYSGRILNDIKDSPVPTVRSLNHDGSTLGNHVA